MENTVALINKSSIVAGYYNISTFLKYSVFHIYENSPSFSNHFFSVLMAMDPGAFKFREC